MLLQMNNNCHLFYKWSSFLNGPLIMSNKLSFALSSQSHSPIEDVKNRNFVFWPKSIHSLYSKCSSIFSSSNIFPTNCVRGEILNAFNNVKKHVMFLFNLTLNFQLAILNYFKNQKHRKMIHLIG